MSRSLTFLPDELRRLAGPDDATPEGALKAGVTASIRTLNAGIFMSERIGSAELRMKHYVRLRAAMLAVADEIEAEQS